MEGGELGSEAASLNLVSLRSSHSHLPVPSFHFLMVQHVQENELREQWSWYGRIWRMGKSGYMQSEKGVYGLFSSVPLAQ